MAGVCIGVRHTCGFTNDSLGEHFCNGNTCSFPLMVRCRAALLYLELFYMERSLTFKGRLICCGIPVICSVLATCYYKSRTLTKHSARSRCALILHFSPWKNNFIIYEFYFYGVWDWTRLESVVWFAFRFNFPVKPHELKRGFWVFEEKPAICKTGEWWKFSCDHRSLLHHLARLSILEPFITP